MVVPDAERLTSLRHDDPGSARIEQVYDVAGRTVGYGRIDSLHGLWAVDGLFLTQIARIPTPDLDPNEAVSTGRDLLFIARGPEGSSLWSTDGTPSGTGPVHVGTLLDGVPFDRGLQILGEWVDESGDWLLVRVRSDGESELRRTDLIVRRPGSREFQVVARDFRWFPQIRRVSDRILVLSVGDPTEVRAFGLDGTEVECDLGRRRIVSDFHASFRERLVAWSFEPEGRALVALSCGEAPQLLTLFPPEESESLPRVEAHEGLLWFQWRDRDGVGRVRVFDGLDQAPRTLETSSAFPTCQRAWCLDEGPSLLSLKTGERLTLDGSSVVDFREREDGTLDVVACAERNLIWFTVDPATGEASQELRVNDGCWDVHATPSRVLFRRGGRDAQLWVVDRVEGYVDGLYEPPRDWSLGTEDLTLHYAFPQVLGVHRNSTGDGLEFLDGQRQPRLGPFLNRVTDQVRVGRFVFVARSSFDFGLQLWVHDTQSLQTQFIRSWISAGAVFQYAPMHLAADPERGGAWVAYEDREGPRLWFSDGTPDGTEDRGDLLAVGDNILEAFTVGRLPILVVDDLPELRALDGSDRGWSLDGGWVRHVEPGSNGTWLCVSRTGGQGLVFFDAVEPRVLGSFESCQSMQAFDDRVVLPHPRPSSTVESVIVVSASGETVRLDREDLGLERMGMPIVSNESIYFAGQDPAHGMELWVSDGTLEGTRRIVDLYPGPGSGTGFHSPNTFVAEPRLARGGAYFLGRDSEHGHRLWVTDGTADGTAPVGNQPEGPLFPPPRVLGRTESHVYWSAVVDGSGSQVHRLDRPQLETEAPSPSDSPSSADPGDLPSASGCTTAAARALSLPLFLLLLVPWLTRRRLHGQPPPRRQ